MGLASKVLKPEELLEESIKVRRRRPRAGGLRADGTGRGQGRGQGPGDGSGLLRGAQPLPSFFAFLL